MFIGARELLLFGARLFCSCPMLFDISANVHKSDRVASQVYALHAQPCRLDAARNGSVLGTNPVHVVSVPYIHSLSILVWQVIAVTVRVGLECMT